MSEPIPATMNAIAINRFGDEEEMRLQTLPVPEIAADEVLIKLKYAGVGSWDPFERQGGFAEMQSAEPAFPYILGSEGSGTVAALGKAVTTFKTGQHVYAASFLNPRGGFYAQYVAVRYDLVAPVPSQLTIEQASCALGVGLTALRGLEDTLHLQPDQTLLVFGASGPMGLAAVQLAKKLGAKVFAVASGDDGTALAREAGADAATDGHAGNAVEVAQQFCPQGFDAALITAGGSTADTMAACVRQGGTVVFPTGVQPEPQMGNYELKRFDGMPDGDIVRRFNALVNDGTYRVHVAQVFDSAMAAQAHRALDAHHQGSLVLKVA